MAPPSGKNYMIWIDGRVRIPWGHHTGWTLADDQELWTSRLTTRVQRCVPRLRFLRTCLSHGFTTFMANLNPVTERLALATLFLTLGAPLAAGQDTLIRARQLYNQRDYLAAIVAITDAGSVPGRESAAALVRGRARLERFRQTSRLAELVGAREELRGIDPSGLGARGRVELEIGLAEALYLGGSFGAAAELFDSLLARTRVLTDRERDRILDWWATAVDRQSDGGSARARQTLYVRVLDRMEEQLRRGSTSGSVSYWLAAGARGLGDLERAWNAAVAGWVRAPSRTPEARRSGQTWIVSYFRPSSPSGPADKPITLRPHRTPSRPWLRWLPTGN